MYKRNWWKRSLRTAGQTAVMEVLAHLSTGITSGDPMTDVLYGAAFAGAAGIVSALHNAFENLKRNGPVED